MTQGEFNGFECHIGEGDYYAVGKGDTREQAREDAKRNLNIVRNCRA